jgi:hypothetical protein
LASLKGMKQLGMAEQHKMHIKEMGFSGAEWI